MAIEKIIEYKHKEGENIAKVVLQPTANFPKMSYFYIDASDIDILLKNNGLYKVQGNRGTVSVLHCNGSSMVEHISDKYFGDSSYIFRMNNYCMFDLVDSNLELEKVTDLVQKYTTVGYGYSIRHRGFLVETSVDGIRRQKLIRPEQEACKLRYASENQIYTVPYNFMKDRSRCIDLLHLERAGVISEDELNCYLLSRISDNAWYYYRYNLAEEFKKYNLKEPRYTLDGDGFMTHPITGQKLNPYLGEYTVQDITIKAMGEFASVDIGKGKALGYYFMADK